MIFVEQTLPIIHQQLSSLSTSPHTPLLHLWLLHSPIKSPRLLKALDHILDARDSLDNRGSYRPSLLVAELRGTAPK